MEMQIPDLSAIGRQPQQPAVPLFMLKMEALKVAVDSFQYTDETNVLNLADKYLLYVLSPSMPEAHDDAPASLAEDF
jgi:hypothetical protein